MGAEATPSEISRNSQKFEKQFSFISSYFSELNTSVPASLKLTASKSHFFRNSKKNDQYKKRIARFSLQFLKSKRLLSRPLFSCTTIGHNMLFFHVFDNSVYLINIEVFEQYCHSVLLLLLLADKFHPIQSYFRLLFLA